MYPRSLQISILFLILFLLYLFPKATAYATGWQTVEPLDSYFELVNFSYDYDPSISKVIMTYQYKNITGNTINNPRVVNLFLWSNDICSSSWEIMNYNGFGVFSNADQSATEVDPDGYFDWHSLITNPTPPLDSNGMFPSLPTQITQSGVSYPYWDISTNIPGQWANGEIVTFSTSWTVSNPYWIQSSSWIVYYFSSTLNIGNAWANCGDVGIKIHICLENLDNPVGGFQMDLCESIDDCLECTECELTERTQMFDCVVNEVDSGPTAGCCRVILFAKNPGGLINPGECDVVTIVYKLKDLEECCDTCIEIDGENIIVTDEYGYELSSSVGETGMVCPYVCGDVWPEESSPGAGDCGDSVIDIFDILEEVDIALNDDADACQAGPRSDVPTGTPPYCLDPDGVSDILDIMVIIDMVLYRQDCCSYYYVGTIY